MATKEDILRLTSDTALLACKQALAESDHKILKYMELLILKEFPEATKTVQDRNLYRQLLRDIKTGKEIPTGEHGW